MRFYLSIDRTERIILDVRMHGAPMEAIEADAEYEDGKISRSAWQVARDQIAEQAYHYRPGFGYFPMTDQFRQCFYGNY